MIGKHFTALRYRHGLIRAKCVGWCRELDPRFCKFLLTLINKTANINSMLSTTKQGLCDQNIITAITINQLLSLMSQIIAFINYNCYSTRQNLFAHYISYFKWNENVIKKSFDLLEARKCKNGMNVTHM